MHHITIAASGQAVGPLTSIGLNKSCAQITRDKLVRDHPVYLRLCPVTWWGVVLCYAVLAPVLLRGKIIRRNVCTAVAVHTRGY